MWSRWLGHIARMQSVCLPKQLLFGELCKTRPAHGVKKRWRDLQVTVANIKAVGGGDNWYSTASVSKAWKVMCSERNVSLVADPPDSHSHIG